MRSIQVWTLVGGLAIIACGTLTKLKKEGIISNKDKSVFQLFSGRYCRIVSEDGKKETRTSCENLTQFIDADDKLCKQGSFVPKKGYFPDESKPIKLCRDRSDPDLETRETVRFLVFADAGAGQSQDEGYGQVEVAKAMLAVCPSRASTASQKNCDFAIVSGDLIYPSGVESVWDSDFKDRFETTYGGFGDFRFFVVPGNHDYQGNVTAQKEYTWFSDRWRMPNRHYAVPDTPSWLRIYGLDSNAFLGVEDAENTASSQINAAKGHLCAESGWRFLFAHHPVLSHGKHGGDDSMANSMKTFHDECPINVYVSGHDHHQEHLSTNLYDVIVQGAGGAGIKGVDMFPGETLSGDAELGQESFEQRYAKRGHGFAVVEATEAELNVYFYTTSTWNYQIDSFEKEPNFEDHVYHCRWQKGGKNGCEVVSADDEKWLSP